MASLVFTLSFAGGAPAAAQVGVAEPEQASRARDAQNQPPSVAKEAGRPAPTLATATSTPVAAAPAANMAHFFIRRFRVVGGHHLIPADEVENAVSPYLGPYRTVQDIEQARKALEEAYQSRGFQTVSVVIPPQTAPHGVVTLQVNPACVGRLRVHGSRFFSLDEIKREVPSLAEGTVPNFTAVARDIVALNQSSDRQITPTLRAGELPNTVDVDLNVKDTFPLHGSIELNNRSSVDTVPLRVNGNISYDNLWQLGHSAGFSFQVAPQDPNEVEVFSADYVARFPDINWLSILLEGTKQNSNVSTLGGIGVAGRGDVAGAKAIFNLPTEKNFYHSISVGFDYKHFEQNIDIGGTEELAPITYVPLGIAYSATWKGSHSLTELNASLDFALRELGSGQSVLDNRRFGATGNYALFRGDLARTQDLPWDFQFYAKVQSQVTNEPLPDSEEFSGGGLGTVRGYLESEALGDNALTGTAELRTPSLGDFLGKEVNDWRFYGFIDAAYLTVNQALPEQASNSELASFGAGTHLQLADHVNGSADLSRVLLDGPNTAAGALRLTFRFWLEF